MALLRYHKPDHLNRPLADDDSDPSQGYTPPPIIQNWDQDPSVTVQQDPNAPLIDPGFSPPPSEPDGTQGLSAPDNAQGIDPSIAANVRSANDDRASTLLANAARKPGLPDIAPDTAIQPAEPDQSIIKGTAPPMPNYNARSIGRATVPVDREAGGGQPSSVTPTGPVLSLTDKHGRPIVDTSITDPLARSLDYQERLNNWEPPKAKGWHRYLPAIISGLGVAAGVAGKNEGAVAANMKNALGYSLNPAMANKQWKDKELKDVQDEIDGHLEQQKTIAGIAHTKAEAKKLGEPVARPKRIVKDKNGVYRPIDPETGRDENGNLVQGETQKAAAGGFKGWVHDADGVAHFYENGQDTGRLDPGRNKVKLADGRLVDPTQSYGAELTAGREGLADERTNEANKQENARIQANIKSAQVEQGKVESALKNTAPMVTRTKYNPETAREERYEERNPIYVDLENRRDRLIDSIRTLNGQLKPIVAPRANTISSTYTTPPAGGYSEKNIRDRWAATPPNKRVDKTADDAVARARANKLIQK